MVAMLRLGRAIAFWLLAVAGLSMAHGVAYLLTFRCWSCHDDLMSATHAAFASSSACVLGVIAIAFTVVAGRAARAGRMRISASRLLLAQAATLAVLQVLDRGITPSQTLAVPTLVLELALLVATALLFARFARVVESAVHAIADVGTPTRHHASRSPVGPVTRGSGWSPTIAFNATGFLRAPPLPA